jgi:MoxR-like ATPase
MTDTSLGGKLGIDVAGARKLAGRIVDNVEKVMVGKSETVRLAVIALISQGHLLIEDAPGLGKTMLARSLARSINCTFKRIQFTPDMLPGDITGVTVFNQKLNEFEFHPGPLLAQVVLADEINRATPKVQSALLEAMEEKQVTVDGVTHRMPIPFHVLATQNPVEYEGTFPLPEAQLDRFLLRLDIGYPSKEQEIAIMENQQYIHPIEQISPVVDTADVLLLQETAKKVYVDDLVKQYIVALVEATRRHPSIYLGASPRGSRALFRASQARALLHGREYVLPDDVKALAGPALAHRTLLSSMGQSHGKNGREAIAEILETVPVPGILPAQ